MAQELTDRDVGDPDLVKPLLEANGAGIRHIFAAGTYNAEGELSFKGFDVIRRTTMSDQPLQR